ncbi:MAG: GntR family transcriptional regulator [Clostridia bacterium]|nr:GntR family transcriptional regulator [Clostridia bacterium]
MEHRMISLADQVFEELERDILSGAFERGEILTEIKLSERLGVSRTPIREALRRLEQEHIIESTSKGAKVIGISRTDIADICEIRLRLEGLAARWAAERADEEGIRILKETVELQEFYTQKSDPDSIKNADSRFHQTIYALCGSNSMRDTLEPLHRKLLKYRRVSVSAQSRAEKSLEEHRAIYEAIAAHDGERAETLTILHVKNARDSIMQREKGM